MKKQDNIYRKNFSLILIFLVLISITFIVALIVSYSLNENYVENEFESKKSDVLEQTIKPYNDLFQNKIPEITSYQGFLDSASAAKYATSVLKGYPFVKNIVFYEMLIGSKTHSTVFKNNIGISPKFIYRFELRNNRVTGTRIRLNSNETDFEQMAVKLSDYITYADTSGGATQSETFKTFYDVKPGKINYSNILRREDIKLFRELQKHINSGSFYKQNMMTFNLDPYSLRVKNVHKELYREVAIQPVVYEKYEYENRNLFTEVALPGALSNFKLYFTSSKGYLNTEIKHRFLPIIVLVSLTYCFLMFIGWLIYRNLHINSKLFKLQYDFINNFTHEFKTPVSVIKIAGSNLSCDNELSERQRKQYGRILNEEADKLNDLMNKLLSFTQLENKAIKIKRERIEIKNFIENYIESFKVKYPDFKINAKIHNVQSFFADPVLLGSIFQNIIENSYKYSPLYRKELYINIINEKRTIVFSFADKGIGIQKEEMSNIFKKFYRVENQYNQNGSVGLGLAFCKELVNFMHGEIKVKSKVNEGSEFIVTLPYEN